MSRRLVFAFIAVSLFCVLLFVAQASYMEISAFENSLLRSALYDYDVNKDGKLSEEEIQNIKKLSLNGSGNVTYDNLNGIEWFPYLEELTVTKCNLSSLDVHNNTNLKKL